MNVTEGTKVVFKGQSGIVVGSVYLDGIGCLYPRTQYCVRLDDGRCVFAEHYELEEGSE